MYFVAVMAMVNVSKQINYINIYTHITMQTLNREKKEAFILERDRPTHLSADPVRTDLFTCTILANWALIILAERQLNRVIISSRSLKYINT